MFPSVLFIMLLFFHKILTECDTGLYGANCEEFCSPNCITPGICDKVTGQCEGGCQAGWKNAQCDQGKIYYYIINIIKQLQFAEFL